MNGFNKILTFGVWGNFKNARNIADDIILSLVRNSGLKEEDVYLPTYTSTIKESLLCFIERSGYDKDETDDENWEEKYVTEWIIRIYEVKGNRGSKLSITQNKKLRDIICQ